jgi:hypothetical protein
MAPNRKLVACEHSSRKARRPTTDKAPHKRPQREKSFVFRVEALLTTCIFCEVKVILANLGGEPFDIRRGDRIAQLVPAAVQQARFTQVEELDDTARGAGGFGSTGV